MKGAGPGQAAGREDAHELTEVARELALRAGEVTLRYFGEVLAADLKSDGSPVTSADREAEGLLREEIERRYPDHSILGEEFGERVGSAPVRWVLDPIDGTRAFMRGVPLYAVLIGIEVAGTATVGVAHFPALDETIVACRGRGCTWWTSSAAPPLTSHVSEVRDIGEAMALTTDPATILSSPIASGWRDLSDSTRLVRGWGDAYGHVLVATGRAEIMIDPVLSSWDAAPLLPIVEESGGRFTDLSGHQTIHGGSGVSTNGHLHEVTLRLITEAG